MTTSPPPPPDSAPARPRLWRRRLRSVLVLLCVVLAATGGILYALYQTPDFYEQALTQYAPDARLPARDLENELLELHNAMRRAGNWQAVLREEDINRWLARRLPQQFPDLLPESVHDPRVAITDKALLVACRYQGARLKAIVSVVLEVSMADEPCTLALRIRQVRAGLFPLPLKSVLDEVTKLISRSPLILNWRQIDGDPVALVTIPQDRRTIHQRAFEIDMVQIDRGLIRISGRTYARSRGE